MTRRLRRASHLACCRVRSGLRIRSELTFASGRATNRPCLYHRVGPPTRGVNACLSVLSSIATFRLARDSCVGAQRPPESRPAPSLQGRFAGRARLYDPRLLTGRHALVPAAVPSKNGASSPSMAGPATRARRYVRSLYAGAKNILDGGANSLRARELAREQQLSGFLNRVCVRRD
jgi:hypothetical protein